ncbi:MAG: cyclic nucleotide-binding domain-containing protein [Gloeobacterales cyanobacterium]
MKLVLTPWSNALETLHLFRHASDTLSLSAGEYLFQQGDKAELMYILVEGEVDILVGDTIVDTVGPETILGEMAMIRNEPRSASVRAKTACRVVPIDRKRFQFLIEQTPYFAIEVMRILADRLQKMDSWLLSK